MYCAVNQPGLDIFGQRPDAQAAGELYDCPQCRRKFPSGRYAIHLEKCLGMGRQSTRISSRR